MYVDMSLGDVLQYDDGTLYIITKKDETGDCYHGWQPGLPLYWRVILPFRDMGRMRCTGRNSLQDVRAGGILGNAQREADYITSLLRDLRGRTAP